MYNQLRIIGDVHGKRQEYLKIVQNCNYSVQLGDMDFEYSWLPDYRYHRFFGGNHDNYLLYSDTPQALGHHRAVNMNGVPFFFIRGAYSIDRRVRKVNVDFFHEEELDHYQLRFLVNQIRYLPVKPDIILTHDCPSFLYEQLGINDGWFSITSQILSIIWDKCRPKLWLFGHHHKSITMSHRDTTFRCLNELEYVDINSKGEICG